MFLIQGFPESLHAINSGDSNCGYLTLCWSRRFLSVFPVRTCGGISGVRNASFGRSSPVSTSWASGIQTSPSQRSPLVNRARSCAHGPIRGFCTPVVNRHAQGLSVRSLCFRTSWQWISVNDGNAIRNPHQYQYHESC